MIYCFNCRDKFVVNYNIFSNNYIEKEKIILPCCHTELCYRCCLTICQNNNKISFKCPVCNTKNDNFAINILEKSSNSNLHLIKNNINYNNNIQNYKLNKLSNENKKLKSKLYNNQKNYNNNKHYNHNKNNKHYNNHKKNNNKHYNNHNNNYNHKFMRCGCPITSHCKCNYKILYSHMLN